MVGIATANGSSGHPEFHFGLETICQLLAGDGEFLGIYPLVMFRLVRVGGNTRACGALTNDRGDPLPSRIRLKDTKEKMSRRLTAEASRCSFIVLYCLADPKTAIR